MLARIFSSVLLPLPFGPMTPKNSPASTVKVKSCSVGLRSYTEPWNGWRNTSLSVVRCPCGIENVFETCSTSIAGEINSDTLCKIGFLPPEEPEAKGGNDDDDAQRDDVRE